MTREEAKTVLSNLILHIDGEWYEAVKLAIEALSAIKTNNSTTEITNSTTKERTEERTKTHECDYISRQDAIDAVTKHFRAHDNDLLEVIAYEIEQLPSAEPEVKPISYMDCANAMLMMWMDEVLTDGEYNRIMDKLNAHWEVEQ